MSFKSKFLAASASMILAASLSGAAFAETAKNVVLVHGAFADGSGWQEIYKILKKDGYKVSIVQEPETSLADDIAATKRVLDQQTGPTILVGHSYGGAIITGAGVHPCVTGLVYVAAFQPDKGESAMSLAKSVAPVSNGIRPTKDGFLYLDPAEFRADFAADLPESQTEFMADSQVLVSAPAAFGAVLEEAAWKTKPSWAIVATDDKAINPELERTMSKRANSKVTEIKASHAVYISHAAEVAKVIESAAEGASK